jgi:GDP-L-fucose synthase
MKVLIIGGFGFVGKNLCNALENSEHEIFPFSRKNGLDLLDYSLTKKIIKEIKPEAIINCAAHVGSLHYVTTYTADVISENVQMALNLYRAVKEVCPSCRIVNPLSNCSYPGTANIQIETEWFDGPVHESVYSYGNSKRMIYILSHCYKAQYGITTINFLVPNTFGPGDHTDPNKVHALNGMIIRMIKAFRSKENSFEVWGTGKPIREWSYIKDVVNFLIIGLTTNIDLIYPINIAQNKGHSIMDSANIIAKSIGFEGKLIFNDKYQDGAPVKILDNTKFKSFFPDYTFFDYIDGIKNYYMSILR